MPNVKPHNAAGRDETQSLPVRHATYLRDRLLEQLAAVLRDAERCPDTGELLDAHRKAARQLLQQIDLLTEQIVAGTRKTNGAPG